MDLDGRIASAVEAIRNKFNLVAPKLLPAGGTAGQVLTKVDAANYNATWQASSGIGLGSFVTPTWSAPKLDQYTGVFARFEPAAGFNTLSVLGQALTVVGTATARIPAVTSLPLSKRRLGIVSVATVNGVAGFYNAQRWLATGSNTFGGFSHYGRFMISDAATVATARMFYGFRDVTTTLTNVDPTTLLNIIAVGHGAADTTLQIYTRGTGALSQVSLPAGFPATAQTPYFVAFYAPRNPTASGYAAAWYVRNELTGLEASGIVAAASAPLGTVTLAFATWRTNNATALAVGLDVGPHIHEQQA